MDVKMLRRGCWRIGVLVGAAVIVFGVFVAVESPGHDPWWSIMGSATILGLLAAGAGWIVGWALAGFFHD